MVVIYQEVITHEHVVSMMKAAIRDTQDQPMFVSLPAPFLLKSFQGWFRAIDSQAWIFLFPPLMHRHNQFQTDSKQVPGTNFDLGLQTSTAMAKKLALNIKANYKCYELYAS